MADEVMYQEAMYDSEAIPPADELIAGGSAFTGKIMLGAGSYQRGDIMMNSNGVFTPASAEGLSTTKEACILSRDIEIPDGSIAEVAAYFMGHYNKKALRLGGQSLSGSESADSVIESLRVLKIFVR